MFIATKRNLVIVSMLLSAPAESVPSYLREMKSISKKASIGSEHQHSFLSFLNRHGRKDCQEKKKKNTVRSWRALKFDNFSKLTP